MRAAVVERNRVAGGRPSTAEVTLPALHDNLHANFHSVGAGPVVRDFELERHGLRYLYPADQHTFLFCDATPIRLYADVDRMVSSIARYSKSTRSIAPTLSADGSSESGCMDKERWRKAPIGPESSARILGERVSDAPNLAPPGVVLGRPLRTPLDIERHTPNMVRGGHPGGAYTPNAITDDLGLDRWWTPVGEAASEGSAEQ